MAAVISIKSLNKTYKNGFSAVTDLSLEVQAGEFIALLGPNGAGKSTTIGILTTLVNKTSGQIVINGYDLAKKPLQAKAELGVVPQEFNFNPFESVEQILLNQASFQGIVQAQAKLKVDQLLDEVGLTAKRKQAAQTLSGGMKRRLMVARALIHDPKVLILDEPTAGVDIEVRQGIYQFLEERNKQGLTIILTTHYLEEAERLCDRIAIINHGQIIKDIKKRSFI
ncbi:ABC transporter ATP-binding protein [Piscirickettsia litoralis]|uniref:ABC transporter ATP-binding protein n=1 Tax=Piscirickettsia litoralis TaxID=1891921 RepID=UPI000AACFFC7|nr:ABC transporter ATP-binding protein [Piscirickettsia litoralis]